MKIQQTQTPNSYEMSSKKSKDLTDPKSVSLPQELPPIKVTKLPDGLIEKIIDLLTFTTDPLLKEKF